MQVTRNLWQRWIPDWAVESRQLTGLSADERRAIQERQREANESLAPYIGMASVLIVMGMLLVDINRYQAGRFQLNLSGLFYTTAVVCHVVVAISIFPALSLLYLSGADRQRVALKRVKLHLSFLVSGMLLLAFVAVAHHGRFMRLACVLILVNLIYSLPWRVRMTANLLSLVVGSFVIFSKLGIEVVAPTTAFAELITLVSLSGVGGAILHRDRIAGYTAQFRESVHLARLREEISVAAQLQQSLLPAPWPPTADFSVHGLMRPAQDIGGDFYDHFNIPNGAICLVVADVCGKGIPAGLFSMSAKSALHATTLELSNSTTAPDPGTLIAGVNTLLHEGNKDLLFVTALYALYHPTTGQVDLVNAGHVKPLLIGRSGGTRWLDAPRGVALGARARRTYCAARIELLPGDTLLFITDGITEALNAEFEEFGAARVQAALDGVASMGPADCISRLLAAVDAFTEGVPQSDDITCIALTHRPSPQNLPH